jgi:hypothetical protein
VGVSPAGTGLGLLATASIKRGEQVLIVPLSLALSMDTVRAGPVGRAIGGWEPNLGEAVLVAVQLLYEASQGDKSKCVRCHRDVCVCVLVCVCFSYICVCMSVRLCASARSIDGYRSHWSGTAHPSPSSFPFSPPPSRDHHYHTPTTQLHNIQQPQRRYAAFLRALPRPGQDGFDHPLFWGAEELAVLSQSSTRNLKEQLVDACEADFASLQATLLSKGAIPGLTPQNVDLPTFKWAVATVLARAFFADGGLRLCPLLDMANHGAVAQGNEPESAGLGIFGGKGLRVVADRDYAAGEEVTISYGPKSGIEFLEDHGFVPPLGDPLRDGLCELAFEVTADDKFLDDKEDILSSAGLGLRQTFDVRADGGVDGGMIQFLRLKCLRDMDAFLLEAVFRPDVLTFMELPVSEANEQAVDEAVIACCQTALDAFKDAQTMTLAALEGSGSGLMDPRRLEALTRVRESERAALEAAQAWAERDMTTSDIKEYYQDRRLNELGLCGPLSDDEMAGSAGRSTRNLDW